MRVEFLPHFQGTEVVLTHDRLADDVRDMHLQGWIGCLDGLKAMFNGVEGQGRRN